ncbi:amidase [Virgisporangium ochraceum]|uniref:Amidase n=1 Tax=Virgisporangium ochraceum TaxID=65505 RepID=A0A8J4A1B8_9ACTN|nr:amidase [Virgisporangium ochraceum]
MTIAAGVNAGEFRAVDVVEDALARIAARDGDLRAFREVWPERARRAARLVDAAGRPLPLAGVPLGVKASERPGSAQVARLVAAGCVPVGATAVPEKGTTAWQTWGHTDRGPTVNPWRADRTPGGSSAGSAAAVAAGLVPLATGVDGAGSVRIPAAWCGVVGVKVTNPDPGRLTAPGPLAGSVADAAAYLGIAVAADAGTADADAAAVRAVWSADLGFADVDEGVVAVARSAAGRLFAAGVTRVDHDLALEDPAATWLALRRGDRADRAVNDERLAAAFEVADVVLTPTAPVSAHGHDGPGDAMSVSLTWAFNLSGHPAASVPAGLGPDGVPVGLQVVGRHGAEETVLRVAAMLAGVVTMLDGHGGNDHG